MGWNLPWFRLLIELCKHSVKGCKLKNYCIKKTILEQFFYSTVFVSMSQAAKAFLFSFRAFLLPTAQSFQKSHLAPAISLAPVATALLPLPAQAVEGLLFYKSLEGWMVGEIILIRHACKPVGKVHYKLTYKLVTNYDED